MPRENPKSEAFYRDASTPDRLDVDYAVQRNNNNINPDARSLPPPVQGSYRIAPVSELAILSKSEGDCETLVSLGWMVNSLIIPYAPVFNVYAQWSATQTAPVGTRQSTAQQPSTEAELVGKTTTPPIEVRLRSNEQRRCTLTVETRLSNGFTGNLEESPAVSLVVEPVMMKIYRVGAAVTITPLQAVGFRDLLILADATSGAFTVTAPNVGELLEGQRITVKKTDAGANAVTVSGKGAQAIDGGTIALAAQYDCCTIAADIVGLTWWQVFF